MTLLDPSSPESSCVKADLAHYLKSTASLRCVSIKSDEDLWNYEIFLDLARHQTITKLVMPQVLVPGPWLQSMLQVQEDKKPFERVRDISMRLHEAQIQLFITLVPKITNLSIQLRGVYSDVLTPISRLASLERLYLAYDDGDDIGNHPVNGEGLLSLARNCKNLSSIEIMDLYPCNTGAVKLLDSTIQEFSSLLPRLQKFSIPTQDSRLTLNSLVSFGQNCKGLTELTISADVDLRVLVRTTPAGLFQSLRGLRITPPAEQQLKFNTPDEALTLMKQILKTMPNCVTFRSGHRDFVFLGCEWGRSDELEFLDNGNMTFLGCKINLWGRAYVA